MSPAFPSISCLLLLLLSPASAFAEDVDIIWKNLMVEGQHAVLVPDYPRAEQVYQKALKEAERFGTSDSRVVATLRSQGAVFQSQKKLTEAEAAFRRAISILDKDDVEDNAQFADLSLNLGIVLTMEGSPSAALPLLTRSLAIFSRHAGGESLDAASVHCAKGDAYQAMKSWREAADSLKRCADIREANNGMMSAAFGDAVYGLAVVYEKEGKYALADARFRLAEKIREKTSGITSTQFAEVLEAHAAMLKALGRTSEAAQDSSLAAAIRRQQTKK